jgi:hypothetical protein
VRRGSTGPVPISGALPAGAVLMGYAAELLSPALLPELELQGASRARGDDPAPTKLSKGGPIPSSRARTLNAAIGSPA